MGSVPQRGDFVRVRSRRWLVEDERLIEGLKTLRLACVDHDAQGDIAEVLWDAEIDGSIRARAKFAKERGFRIENGSSEMPRGPKARSTQQMPSATPPGSS